MIHPDPSLERRVRQTQSMEFLFPLECKIMLLILHSAKTGKPTKNFDSSIQREASRSSVIVHRICGMYSCDYGRGVSFFRRLARILYLVVRPSTGTIQVNNDRCERSEDIFSRDLGSIEP